ncbi:Gfo/Idh/MocA family protein [Streptomyces hokutonensis]|uniref:Gfo/Idh/MocA family protein n=1 Tax=Streptomyces hokutonensis TaxID=1306990 RepID=UPI003819663A
MTRARSARPVIVGTGLIASLHARALTEIGAPPVAAWSPNPTSRARFRQQWGTATPDSLAEALGTADATHVHVCSTPMHHLEPIREAARRGLAVICEKPLTVDPASAQQALAAVDEAGVPAWVNFNRRMDGGIQTLRHLIAKGTIGAPVSVFGHYRQQWNANPSGWDWRYDPAHVGPLRTVVEIGSHWFDLTRFVLGADIQSVAALAGFMGERDYDTGQSHGRGTPPNEDLFGALLRFENGVVGQVYGTELAHDSYDDIELRIDGTLGSATWTSTHPNIVQVGNKTDGMRTLGLDSPGTSLAASIAAMYDGSAATAGVATFADGLANARVIDAVRASIESNTWKDLH